MHTTEDIKGTGERKKPYGTEDFADKTAYSKLQKLNDNIYNYPSAQEYGEYVQME